MHSLCLQQLVVLFLLFVPATAGGAFSVAIWHDGSNIQYQAGLGILKWNSCHAMALHKQAQPCQAIKWAWLSFLD
jgi:hypothetical protein